MLPLRYEMESILCSRILEILTTRYTGAPVSLLEPLVKSWLRTQPKLMERFTVAMLYEPTRLPGSFGLHFEMGDASMSQLLEYMNSDAGLVDQFRAMQSRFVFSDGSLASASNALTAFFQRMCSSGIGTVFATLPSVPVGTELIMNHFWQWLNQYISSPMLSIANGQKCYENLTRLVTQMMLGKADSQFRQGARLFIWVEQDVQNPFDLSKDYKIVKTWTGVAATRFSSESKTQLDNQNSKPARLYICECKAVKFGDLVTYAHGILVGSKIANFDFADSQEEAAERCYESFYSILTAWKFSKAKEAANGKQAIIFGNWINFDEWLAMPAKSRKLVQAISNDERNNKVFVIGLPKMQKETLVTEIQSIKRPTRSFDLSDFTADVSFENGVKLSASLDWRVYKPEQYVEGEVYCTKCKALYGGVSGCDMRDVKSYGPLCGPCRDNMVDTGADLDNLMDV